MPAFAQATLADGCLSINQAFPWRYVGNKHCNIQQRLTVLVTGPFCALLLISRRLISNNNAHCVCFSFVKRMAQAYRAYPEYSLDSL